MVARRRKAFYTDRHPEPDDIFIVIEVADSSLRYDPTEKAPRYGRAGVPEMWIVDVDAAAVTVHTDPGPDGYATRRVLRRGDEVAAASGFRPIIDWATPAALARASGRRAPAGHG